MYGLRSVHTSALTCLAQRTPPARGLPRSRSRGSHLALRTSHFTLRTSHFALRTYFELRGVLVTYGHTVSQRFARLPVRSARPPSRAGLGLGAGQYDWYSYSRGCRIFRRWSGLVMGKGRRRGAGDARRACAGAAGDAAPDPGRRAGDG
jgi:hypothetical protein